MSQREEHQVQSAAWFDLPAPLQHPHPFSRPFPAKRPLVGLSHSCLFVFPDSSVGKESTCNVGDLGSIPGLGRTPGEGKGYPLQYSGLENSTDESMGSQRVATKTQLSDFHFTSLHAPPLHMGRAAPAEAGPPAAQDLNSHLNSLLPLVHRSG